MHLSQVFLANIKAYSRYTPVGLKIEIHKIHETS